MKVFRNKKTGKVVNCDERVDNELIKDLEKDPDFKELMFL